MLDPTGEGWINHGLGTRPGSQARTTIATGRAEKARQLSKDAIFHYVYGVLHDPVYREKYALNLKREFPRIPFYRRLLALGWMGRDADGAAYRL